MSVGLAVVALCVMITGCGPAKTETPKDAITHTSLTELPGDDTGVTEKTTLSDEEYLAVVPEQDRYMFLSGRCASSFPDNKEIKRISLLIINYSMTWKSIYGSVDLEAGKATYGMTDGGLYTPEEYQVYEITDADITTYRNAFDSTLLYDELQLDNGYWKMAVEYKDGTCYAYQFDANGYMRYTPENIMINAYFDRMDLDDNQRMLFGIQSY
ncbi:MAG: hypothetical protein J5379_05585 [Clostridiales bacterium]|nr:hypothetical protein [Clostridiales bacterium]